MTTEITVQRTPQGVLIPYTALEEWQDMELEVIQEKHRIVIRPKAAPITRDDVRDMLREVGLLYEIDAPAIEPVSQAERERLAKKLAEGPPLSELIIAEREDRI
ncbi:MAG TPA: hypothetical protein PLJ78_06755 [Anaerolineae bacterium]|nr:hypothetical protein [Anaerolineae bacterium]HQK13626.1 hypothetical protein [Anaerolineae bacterium]